MWPMNKLSNVGVFFISEPSLTLWAICPFGHGVLSCWNQFVNSFRFCICPYEIGLWGCVCERDIHPVLLPGLSKMSRDGVCPFLFERIFHSTGIAWGVVCLYHHLCPIMFRRMFLWQHKTISPSYELILIISPFFESIFIIYIFL